MGPAYGKRASRAVPSPTASPNDSDIDGLPSYDDVAAASAVADYATVTDDGRINVDLNSRLSRTLSRIIHLPPPYTPSAAQQHPEPVESAVLDDKFPVQLNIVVQVVGSRGDVQPFVALGAELGKHGHRVRLATHANFRAFVENAGLEFFDIGGDPEELMAYMVKNPGFIPSMKSLRAGEVSRKREMITTILDGCWKSCIEPDSGTHSSRPFVADAIIANPPSFANIHCAEALGIPLHIMFTMPWTATRSFPHPLANITSKHNDAKSANYLSYVVVEWMTWQGLGDVINDWRHQLDLEPIPHTEGPMLSETLQIPHTYCWSSALVPRPEDWPAHVDVSGFFFRETPDYKPPVDLKAFLNAGPPPVYIGFGSIVIDDPAEFSSLLLEAVASCGVRAIISRGWSRLDGPVRSDVFWLEDCPHEWLFQHVFAVVHHGGAGTTACGLLNARPTAIVPFFGDQAFWGRMVATAGAGPDPIPYRELDARNLADAITFCRSDPAQDAALSIAKQIKQEDGVKSAVRSFHANLPLDKMRCAILPHQPASFAMKVGGKTALISKCAAAILTDDAGVLANSLKLYRPKAIVIENHRWDPVTGLASSLISTATGLVDASSGIVLKPTDAYRRGRAIKSSPQNSRAPSQQSARSGPGIRKAATDSSTQSEISAGDYSVHGTIGSGSSVSDSEAALGPSSSTNGSRIAGDMALASGKSFGKFFSTWTRGIIVDMPLATAEGFRAMPRLWGSEVKDYGRVTDWKSGGIVAGKTLVQGITDGLHDMVTEPVKGAQEGGAWGATKGVAKGTASLLTKTVSGGLGLVAYPGQGISKSIHTLFHSDTSKRIVEARRREGEWMVEHMSLEEQLGVVDRYFKMQNASSNCGEKQQ